MTLNELIDLALAGTEGEALYAAQDQVMRAAQNARGQVLDVRTNAVLDVLRGTLRFPRPLTTDERTILEGLRTKDEPTTPAEERPSVVDRNALAAALDTILGTDLEVRGIGRTLARGSASWLTHLMTADTVGKMKNLCKAPTFRDTRVAEALWTHRDAVIACFQAAGVRPFTD